MSEELIAYNDEQHLEISRLVLDSRDRSIPEVGVKKTSPLYPGVCRLILAGNDAPTYQPKTVRECVVFELNPDGAQRTIEFSGHELEGDLVLTFGALEIQISCKATTEQLRQKLIDNGIKPVDCRATVFPGLWEFDLNGGRYRKDPPQLDCVAFEPESDDDETPVFSGQLLVVEEAWVSVCKDGENCDVVETRDWIPFRSGQIQPGAIGAAVWSHEAGWLVLAWQCRDYSFRTIY